MRPGDKDVILAGAGLIKALAASLARPVHRSKKAIAKAKWYQKRKAAAKAEKVANLKGGTV